MSLEDYFEIGPPIQERGLKVEGLQPNNDEVPHVLIAKIYRDDKLLAEEKVQMFHPNIWGIDTEDMGRFEKAVDKLVEKYGDPRS